MSWADWDSKHKDIKQRAKNNFIGFKRREGMPQEHAESEFDRIHAAGTSDKYLGSTRIGAKFTANRSERQGHAMHFENAYNHASFEVQKLEYAKLLKGTEGKHWSWHSGTPTIPPKAPTTVPEAAQGVNHPADHVKVANTILAQYGGNKFRAMTGAHTFTASPEKGGALTFKLPKTSGATKGTKYVKTVHDPASDTYDVHMLGRTGEVKHSASGIYADQLQGHFAHHTGLHTHL